MRSSTVAFVFALAAASPLCVLAAGGSSATTTHTSDKIASVDSTLADSSTIVPITGVPTLLGGANATSTQSIKSTTTYDSSFPSSPITYAYNTAYSGSAVSSGSLPSVSGQPGVYSNGTSTVLSSVTATAVNGGTSTATAITEVPGEATSAVKTGSSPSASASASLSAAALSLNGNAIGVGSFLLGGVAVVFGLL